MTAGRTRRPTRSGRSWSTRPEDIRQIVRAALKGYGTKATPRTKLAETLVFDDGQFVGRSYRLGGYLAMWLAEFEIVQFYSPDGAMLGTLDLKLLRHEDGEQPRRQAAA